jgi:hypothetical protein
MTRLSRLSQGVDAGSFVRGASASRSGVCCRLGEELLEILEKIRRTVEQGRHLCVYFLNRLLLPLVCLQYFQELLVNFRFVLETVLERNIISLGSYNNHKMSWGFRCQNTMRYAWLPHGWLGNLP